jgi:hypothetical protein
LSVQFNLLVKTNLFSYISKSCTFNYTSDKDLFAELYRNALSRRLLNKKSVSNDSERGFISKLKAQCGGPYTAKLEGMLNDFLLADEMNKDFEPSYIVWKGAQDKGAPDWSLIPEGLSFDVQVKQYINVYVHTCHI